MRDVKFEVWVRSGPIIEDCEGMVFEGTRCRRRLATGGKGGGEEGRNVYWDMKDFNTLRTLHKSPNFVVIAEPSSGGQKTEEGAVEGVCDGLQIQTFTAGAQSLEEEDSEDEL